MILGLVNLVHASIATLIPVLIPANQQRAVMVLFVLPLRAPAVLKDVKSSVMMQMILQQIPAPMPVTNKLAVMVSCSLQNNVMMGMMEQGMAVIHLVFV